MRGSEKAFSRHETWKSSGWGHVLSRCKARKRVYLGMRPGKAMGEFVLSRCKAQKRLYLGLRLGEAMDEVVSCLDARCRKGTSEAASLWRTKFYFMFSQEANLFGYVEHGRWTILNLMSAWHDMQIVNSQGTIFNYTDPFFFLSLSVADSDKLLVNYLAQSRLWKTCFFSCA